ncbi:MAG: PilZ domain-containing protein [Phycisphaerales bacterium]|nr:PilZ domain-containing protein [Phycisphaerales bacterium]
MFVANSPDVTCACSMGAFQSPDIPLRLNRTILAMMAERHRTAMEHDRRASSRHHFRSGQSVRVRFHRSSGTCAADAIVRDVSNDGLGLWIGAFIHPGTRCSIEFDLDETVAGSVVEIRGDVAWCAHFSYSVHEAGIRIDERERVFLRAPDEDPHDLESDMDESDPIGNATSDAPSSAIPTPGEEPSDRETPTDPPDRSSMEVEAIEDAAARAHLFRMIESRLPDDLQGDLRDRVLQAIREILAPRD